MAQTKKQTEYDAIVGKVIADKEEFERLKTQYFWEQKIHEVTNCLLWLLAWGFLFIICLKLNAPYPITNDITNYYVISGLSALLVLGVLVLIYQFFKWWIESNWQEADDRAKETLDSIKYGS